MSFSHDKLIAHVQNVKSSREFHGEDELLACDFALRITRAENDKVWPDLMADLMDDEPQGALATISRASATVSQLAFDVEHDDVKINVRQGTSKIATFVHARISKFKWTAEDGSEFVSCSARALSDGATIGALCEQLRRKVRIETVDHQAELDLGDEQAPAEQTETPA